VQGGPLVHIIAAKAIAFLEALQPDFKEYQQQIVKNAKAMANEMIRLGHRVVSGGTDNHLFMIDVFARGITGRDAEKALEASHITVNKNTIPFDTNPPMKASGIRIGTPAITTRGMKEDEMREVARIIDQILRAPEDESVRQQAITDVNNLTAQFPLYARRRV
jgi:glycine hydroxymethyltransferase